MKQLLAKLDYQHALLALTLLVTVFGPDVAKALAAFNLPVWAAYVTKGVTVLTGVLALLKQFAPDAVKDAAKAAVILVLCGLFAASQSACLSVAPVVPVTPANQQQVSSCESSAGWHNGAVVTGIGLGIAGTTLGAVAPFESDPGVKGGLAAGAAASAALAGGAAAIAAFAAQGYANGQCPSVTGPLPVAKPGNAASAWPADWPAPSVAGSLGAARVVIDEAGAR